mmetsp:Transcript_1279/g.5035  ORF Transcript_1279/g.5035 Transcript_1279/m.5035 type:complete len:319 (+) Transcript_1279:1600-2556(+)
MSRCDASAPAAGENGTLRAWPEAVCSATVLSASTASTTSSTDDTTLRGGRLRVPRRPKPAPSPLGGAASSRAMTRCDSTPTWGFAPSPATATGPPHRPRPPDSSRCDEATKTNARSNGWLERHAEASEALACPTVEGGIPPSRRSRVGTTSGEVCEPSPLDSTPWSRTTVARETCRSIGTSACRSPVGPRTNWSHAAALRLPARSPVPLHSPLPPAAPSPEVLAAPEALRQTRSWPASTSWPGAGPDRAALGPSGWTRPTHPSCPPTPQRVKSATCCRKEAQGELRTSWLRMESHVRVPSHSPGASPTRASVVVRRSS